VAHAVEDPPVRGFLLQLVVVQLGPRHAGHPGGPRFVPGSGPGRVGQPPDRLEAVASLAAVRGFVELERLVRKDQGEVGPVAQIGLRHLRDHGVEDRLRRETVAPLVHDVTAQHRAPPGLRAARLRDAPRGFELSVAGEREHRLPHHPWVLGSRERRLGELRGHPPPDPTDVRRGRRRALVGGPSAGRMEAHHSTHRTHTAVHRIAEHGVQVVS